MSQSDKNNAELIKAVLKGDLTSFGCLYERHYAMVLGLARSRVGDLHLAEDAAQEAFAIAYRTLSSLNDHSRFKQWLGTICRRCASKVAESRLDIWSISSEHEPACDPSQQALREHVREVINRLDETARELVMLHYFSGLSYQEIAEIVELSPQAIHGRLQRIRRELREFFQIEESKE